MRGTPLWSSSEATAPGSGTSAGDRETASMARSHAQPDRRRPGRARRPARAAGPHPLAGARDGRRLVAGHPAGLRPGAVRALGRRLRLAAGRGRAERLRAAALHARGRARPTRSASRCCTPRRRSRTRCPLVLTHGWPGRWSSSSTSSSRCAIPRRHGGDAADAFHVVCPTMPGYGFSDKPTRAGLGRRAHRRCVGRADDRARLRALRRAGRRLGFGGDDGDRRAARRPLRRDPPQHGRRSRPARTATT